MSVAVVGFVYFQRAVVIVLVLVPVVVDADEDAQHVRLEIEAIGLPALGELIDLVAADAAVEDFEMVVGMIDQQLGGGEPGVAVAEGGLRVGGGVVLFAAGVGDRIALEQDRLAGCDQRLPAGAVGSNCRRPWRRSPRSPRARRPSTRPRRAQTRGDW